METNLCEGCREKDSSVMLRRNDLVMCDMCWGKPMSTEFVLDRSTLWLDDDCEIEKSDKTISENTPQNVIELEDDTEDSMIHFDTPFSNAAMLEFATSDVPDTDTPYGEILNTLEDPELPESTLSQDNNQAEEVTETSQNVDITTIPLISQDQSQEDDEQNGDEDEEKNGDEGDTISGAGIEADRDTIYDTDTELSNNIVLFSDSLLKHLKKYKETPRAKEKFKWDGNLEDLKAFTTLILKLKGNWNSPTKKSPAKFVFKDKNGKITINWWKTKLTLSLQGKTEEVTKFEQKLNNLISAKKQARKCPPSKQIAMDQDVDQGSTLDIPDVNDDQSQNSQSLNSQEGSTTKVKKRTKKTDKNTESEVTKIWQAVNELRSTIQSLIPGKEPKIMPKIDENTITLSTASQKSIINSSKEDQQAEVNKQQPTEKPPEVKKTLITSYFNKITKQEAESLNKIEQTNKISELLRKNKELEKEIHALKDRVTKLTNENKVLKTTTAMRQKSAPIEEKRTKDKPAVVSTRLHKPLAPKSAPKSSMKQNEAKNKLTEKRPGKLQSTNEQNGGQDARVEDPQPKPTRNQKSPEMKRREKEVVIIAGDSIVKGQKGWLMSRTKNVKCHAFSGATCSDMEHFINPIIARKPDHIFLHYGTNDLMDSTPEDIAQSIIKVAKKVTMNKINCYVSSLILRTDNEHLNDKLNLVNKRLKALLVKEKINLITHNNITDLHLNRGGLHLNKRGDAALAYNFIETIRNLNQSI